MHREIKAKVHRETKEGTYFIVLAPRESLTDEVRKFCVDGILKGELRIDDGRHITSEQRKKLYATLADIAAHMGYPPEELKEIMKYRYMADSGADYFSLSDCSVTTARHFITHILNFALEWGVPLMDLLTNRTDDIDAMIYATIKHRRCIICGADGEIHHAEDRIGMGRNRDEIIHIGMRVLCLCRKHHDECHTEGQTAFNEKWKVYGIKADKSICEIWGLKYE
jgi:hypothetical protein